MWVGVTVLVWYMGWCDCWCGMEWCDCAGVVWAGVTVLVWCGLV